MQKRKDDISSLYSLLKFCSMSVILCTKQSGIFAKAFILFKLYCYFVGVLYEKSQAQVFLLQY